MPGPAVYAVIAVVGTVAALENFERPFAKKKDDPEWKSLMLGMGERNDSEWES